MVMNNGNEDMIVNPHNKPYPVFIHNNFQFIKDRMFQELNEPVSFAKILFTLARSWKIHKNQQIPIEEAMDISFNIWRNDQIQN